MCPGAPHQANAHHMVAEQVEGMAEAERQTAQGNTKTTGNAYSRNNYHACIVAQ